MSAIRGLVTALTLTGAVLVPSAHASVVPQDGPWKGTTASGGELAARVTGGGSKMAYSIDYVLQCPGGVTLPGTLVVDSPARIVKDEGIMLQPGATAPLPGGLQAFISGVIYGDFSSSRAARGSYSVRAVVKDAAGQEVGACESGADDWRLKAKAPAKKKKRARKKSR